MEWKRHITSAEDMKIQAQKVPRECGMAVQYPVPLYLI